MRKRPIVTITSIATLLVITSLLIVGCADTSASQSDLDEAQSRIEELEDELDNLQDDYDALIDWYDGIREEVNQHLGDGEDKMMFITPDDDTVAAKVQEITGGFSEDVYQQAADIATIYNWVVDNIEYNSDSRLPYLPGVNENIFWCQDYWRMPSETVEDGVGDCEDMATLLTSMILNYASSAGYPCWCIGWRSYESGHVAVAIPVEGDQLIILDPAGNYCSFDDKNFATVVNDWLSYWQPEPGIYVACVFSDNIYKTFDTTEEFIEWELNR